MSAKELYDYFATATPDYDAFLSVSAPQSVIEVFDKNQNIKYYDDGSSRVIIRSSKVIAQIRLRWPDGITASDSGTIMDMFLDASKANGYAKSFKYQYPNDGHTYVVKFKSRITRTRSFLANIGFIPVDEILLSIEGTISD